MSPPGGDVAERQADTAGAALRIGVIAPTSMVARLAVVPAMVASRGCSLAGTASLSSPEGPHGLDPSVRRFGSYQALVEDPSIEAVYIPLPNSMHREWVERCAAAGKHVLCEKPLAATAADAAAMTSACEAAGVVLMEAYMTPFHPRWAGMLEIISSGRLGRLWSGTAVFTGRLSRPDDHRWRPEMGGGALLDVGIYCLAPLLAAVAADRLRSRLGPAATTGVGRGQTSAVVTPVARVVEAPLARVLRAEARRTRLGVDASFEAALDLEGFTGLIRCSFESVECQRLELAGEEATLVADRAFTPSHGDRRVLVVGADGSKEDFEFESGDPYLAMVEHFADVVKGRAVQTRPPSDSVALAALIDDLASAGGS